MSDTPDGTPEAEQLPPWTIVAGGFPQPLPTNWRILRLEDWVELEIATPGGVGTYFFDPEAARRFGAAMIEKGADQKPTLHAATPRDVHEVNKRRG